MPRCRSWCTATDANRARIIQGYAQGAIGQWTARRAAEGKAVAGGPVVVQDRLWFNEANESHYFLVPGLIVLIMTLIGALLTALVMAREWERGTLEALFVTPVRSARSCWARQSPTSCWGWSGCRCAFWRPSSCSRFRSAGRSGCWPAGRCSTCWWRWASGLLISTATKSQFVASQVTVLVTFLPAMMLSGFLFDLRSMPAVVRLITDVLPARYYVALLQTVFLAGDVWGVILPNAAVLAVMAAVLLLLTRAITRKKLD